MLLVAATLFASGAIQPNPARDMPVMRPGGDALASICPPTSRYEASGRSKTPQPKKLNELPAADAYRTVYRAVDGCEVPIVVRFGVGGR